MSLRRRSTATLAGLAALSALTATACSARTSDDPIRTERAADATAATPSVHTRPQDTKDGAASVMLRSCPQAGADKPVGQNPWGLNCLVLEQLADGTTVTMNCWVSTTPPPGEKSAKWFKVTVTSGDHAGKEGWVWSDLVRNQTPDTPRCASVGHENDPAAPPPEPLRFEVTGTCTSNGGELSNRSSGFTPGEEYSVSAARPDGSFYRLGKDTGTVGADGSVTWKWPCKGDAPGTYSTELVDLGTGRAVEASFTIGAPPEGPAEGTANTGGTGGAEGGANAGGTGGGGSSTGGTAAAGGSGASGGSAAAPPQQPRSERITVFNKVTDGRTGMREDTPAYLSTVTENFCASRGCALSGTEVVTGDRLTATCHTQGARTTNGHDKDSADDTNEGLAESRLWYGVRWSDGRFGYISAVWIDPGQRGGLGLPSC
ncbi:hypothetical protein ACWGJT_16990 [Streptomyces xantholiticus]